MMKSLHSHLLFGTLAFLGLNPASAPTPPSLRLQLFAVVTVRRARLAACMLPCCMLSPKSTASGLALAWHGIVREFASASETYAKITILCPGAKDAPLHFDSAHHRSQ